MQHHGRRTGANAALEDADTAHILKTGAGQLMLPGDRGAIELRKSLPQMNPDNNDGSLHDPRRSLRDS
jgi:hypothetical protein